MADYHPIDERYKAPKTSPKKSKQPWRKRPVAASPWVRKSDPATVGQFEPDTWLDQLLVQLGNKRYLAKLTGSMVFHLAAAVALYFILTAP